MKKVIYLLLLSLLLIGCAKYSEHREAPIVRSGLLTRGIDKQAFLDVWGPPERANVITITKENRGLYASWNAFGGEVNAGDEINFYEEWNYEKYDVKLLFDEGDNLRSWKTDKTVSEIKALARPLPK